MRRIWGIILTKYIVKSQWHRFFFFITFFCPPFSKNQRQFHSTRDDPHLVHLGWVRMIARTNQILAARYQLVCQEWLAWCIELVTCLISLRCSVIKSGFIKGVACWGSFWYSELEMNRCRIIFLEPIVKLVVIGVFVLPLESLCSFTSQTISS